MQAQIEQGSIFPSFEMGSELIKKELGVETIYFVSSFVSLENDNDTFTLPTYSKYDSCVGTKELDCSSVTNISNLLCTAAKNLQMPNCDTSQFESKLREDWFNKAEHLRNRSVEFLARYMPWQLAEEVQRVVGKNN
jgi:hypothetical protein